MAFMPKRVKFRKEMRRCRDRKATRGNYVAYGDYGLQSLDACWLTGRQIEAGRIAAQHFLKRQGKMFIRVFPDKPVSKKPLETRMGKGKGSPEKWVAVVKPGHIMYEMQGVTEEVAREAFRLAAHKLPMRTKFVKREAGDES